MIETLRELHAYAKQYPETVYVISWPVVALLAFAGVQRTKRLAYKLGRKLHAVTIEALAVASCVALGLLLQVGMFELPWKPAAINSLLISWGYMAMIRGIMHYAKAKDCALYYALRTSGKPADQQHDTTIF